MFCPHCKAPIDESEAFCPYCGSLIEHPQKPEAAADEADGSVSPEEIAAAAEPVEAAVTAAAAKAAEELPEVPASVEQAEAAAADAAAGLEKELPDAPAFNVPDAPLPKPLGEAAAFAPDPSGWNAADQAPQTPAWNEAGWNAADQAPQTPAWNEPAPEQPAAPMQEQKRSVLKPVLIGLGGLLVIAALVFGIMKLLGGKKSSNELFRAAENSVDQLTDYLSELPNLKTMIRIGEKMQDKKNAEGDFSIRAEVEGVNVDVSMNARSDMNAKQMQADVTVKIDQISKPIDLGLYLDEENLMIYSGALLAEDEAIALPMKDFGKKWNASELAKMVDVTLPEEHSLSAFPYSDLESMMVYAYGEQWTAFEKTIKLVKFEGTPRFTEGTVKTVTWDRELLKPMYEQAKEDVENFEDMDLVGLSRRTPSVRQTSSLMDTDEMAAMNYARLIPSFIVYVFGQFDENEIEVQLRLGKDDAITGVYAVEDDNYVEILLDGEKNPWEHVVIKSGFPYEYDGKTYEMADGTDITLRIENRQLIVEFCDIHIDTEDEEAYNSSDLVGKLVYDDATGKITAYDEDGNDVFAEEGVEMTVKPDGDRITAHFSMPVGWDEQKIVMDCSIGTLSTPIKASFSKIQNLLELDENKLQGLVMRIMLKVQKLIPTE